MRFADDYTDTRYLAGTSHVDEIPNLWLEQYKINMEAIAETLKMLEMLKQNLGASQQLMGISHTHIIQLIVERDI